MPLFYLERNLFGESGRVDVIMDWKVPSSNPIRCWAGLRDPTSTRLLVSFDQTKTRRND